MPAAGDFARLVGGRIIGDPEVTVAGYAGIEEAGSRDIVFAVGERNRRLAASSGAAVIVTNEPIEGCASTQILVEDPNLAFAYIVRHLTREEAVADPGVHPRAYVHETAEIDPSASIRPLAYVGPRVRIGARTVVHPGTCVEEDVRIGAECVLQANVVIRKGVVIGDRVVLQPGVVIGGDGFGYVPTPEKTLIKIPQVGTVVIEDDVEIGANATVDRARFSETRIREGAKIDNLCVVAHNCVVGRHTVMAGLSGLAGSTRLGDHVTIAGHVGAGGHLSVGDGASVAAFSGISKDLPGGQVYLGIPARPIRQGQKARALQLKLPEMLARIRALEKRVAELSSEKEDGT